MTAVSEALDRLIDLVGSDTGQSRRAFPIADAIGKRDAMEALVERWRAEQVAR